MRFENHLFPITSDEDWATLFPPNQGKVRLEAFPGQEFVVALYQQLHCLDVVRIAFLKLHATPSKTKLANFTEADQCIEQLLQTILCHGDLTLETAFLTVLDGETVPATTGAGIDHRCMDWSRVHELVG